MSAAEWVRSGREMESGTGVVTSTQGRNCVVVFEGKHVCATRARSCLLAPTKGDRVLFAGSEADGLYVLAVLEREDDATVIAVDGPLNLRGTSCEVRAPGAIGLRAGAKVSMATAEVDVRANRVDLALEQLAVLGRRAVVEVEAVRAIAAKVDSLLGSVRQRARSVYRTVEQLEHIDVVRVAAGRPALQVPHQAGVDQQDAAGIEHDPEVSSARLGFVRIARGARRLVCGEPFLDQGDLVGVAETASPLALPLER